MVKEGVYNAKFIIEVKDETVQLFEIMLPVSEAESSKQRVG